MLIGGKLPRFCGSCKKDHTIMGSILGNIGVICWGYIGVMEKKVETTIMVCGDSASTPGFVQGATRPGGSPISASPHPKP